MSLINRSANLLSGWSKGAKNRPPFEGSYAFALALFAGFLLADLGILYVRPNMLPTEPPPARPVHAPRFKFTDVSKYQLIESRNLFNLDGKIPAALTAGESGGVDNVPVLSALPLKLEGTLVHSNPDKSVATISAKGKNEARSYLTNGEIEGLARVHHIERRKVIIRNMNNGRLEYIEIPKDATVTFAAKTPQVLGEVQKSGEFDFTMHREDINKYTSNLGDVLQQARMVPNIVPGSGGRVDGFRFVAIQPGSIFEKLGFKPMDVIKKVNNENVNSPTKAMELYNALKSENRVSLTVERNGRDENFKYDIPN